MSNIFEDSNLVNNLFERAKVDNEWPIIRGYLSKRPEICGWVNSKWNETLLHWASLGNLPAVIDLINYGSNVDQLDNQGRSPLVWCIEKAYFLETDPPNKMASNKIQNEISKCCDCALQLLNFTNCANPHIGSIEQGYSVLELVCRSGFYSLYKAILEKTNTPLNDKEVLSLLEGRWVTEEIFEEVFKLTNINTSKKYFEQSLILCACELFASDRIKEDRLISCYKLFGDLEQLENEDLGLADICLRYKNSELIQNKIENIISKIM